MSNIALVLPAYNEEQTIAATIEDFYQVLPDAAIWVINNRSSDATKRQTALDTLSRLKCKGGVINEKRPGKGNAVGRFAFLSISTRISISLLTLI